VDEGVSRVGGESGGDLRGEDFRGRVRHLVMMEGIGRSGFRGREFGPGGTWPVVSFGNFGSGFGSLRGFLCSPFGPGFVGREPKAALVILTGLGLACGRPSAARNARGELCGWQGRNRRDFGALCVCERFPTTLRFASGRGLEFVGPACRPRPVSLRSAPFRSARLRPPEFQC
jgi:hypothetical protein